MSDLDLETLKKLCEVATPGPWRVIRNKFEAQGIWGIKCKGGEPTGDVVDIVDAEFIAAARTAMPELIEEVNRLAYESDRRASERDKAEKENQSLRELLREARVVRAYENPSLLERIDAALEKK